MMQLHPVRSWLPFACGEPAMLQCTDLPMLLPQLLPRPMQLRKRSGSLSRCACHSLQPTARMKEYPAQLQEVFVVISCRTLDSAAGMALGEFRAVCQPAVARKTGFPGRQDVG